MKKNFKRTLSKILIVVMLLSSNNISVFATENNIGVIISDLETSDSNQYVDIEEVSDENVLDEGEEFKEDVLDDAFEEGEDEEKSNTVDEKEYVDKDQEDLEDVIEENDIEKEVDSASPSESEDIEEYEDANDDYKEELEEDIVEEKIPFDLNIKKDDINILKVNYDTQKIIIDFGKGPRFDKTTNWAGKSGVNKFADEGDGKYSISGPTNYTVSGDDVFIEKQFEGSDYPSKVRAGKSHVELPIFDDTPNAVWKGYKFVGWEDDEGTDIVQTQDGTFNYAFQGNNSSDTTTYKSKWEAVNNDYVLVEKHGIIIDGEFRSIFVSTQTVTHRSNVDVEPKDIPGYKKDSVMAIYNDVENIDALKSLDYNYVDNFISLDEDDLKATAQKSVLGAMPNHDLEIRIIYIPDTNITYNLNIVHKDIYGSVLAEQSEGRHAGDVIDIMPQPINTNYAYVQASISEIVSNEELFLLPLGVPAIDNQMINPTDANDTTTNQGRFYAVMPNQSMTITYYYQLVKENTEVIVKEQVQNRVGGYDTVKVTTISIIPSDGSVKGIYTHTDRRAEGYEAIANIYIASYSDIEDQTVSIFYGYSGNSNGAGVVDFYVTDFKVNTILIQYSFDPGKWTHVLYYYDDAQPGHLEVEEGYNSIDDRYFLRNVPPNFPREPYSLSDIMQGIRIVPDNHNYTYTIHQRATSDNKEFGGPLGDAISLDQTEYKIFVKFFEDPNRWVNITFNKTPECSISDPVEGTVIHIPRDTILASISFPTVTTITGYAHTNYWVDENDVILEDTYFEDMIGTNMNIYPQLVNLVNEIDVPVKPLGYTIVNDDRKGSLYLYTKYPHRRYVLTDADDNHIITKLGADLSSTHGFDNLMPGKTYKLYEIMSGVTESINSGKLVVDSNVSQPFVFGIKSVRDEDYFFDKQNRKINISVLSGESYALLDDRYNIVYNWSTNPNFSNLQNGTYYLIVSKQTSDNIQPNDDKCIRNGVVVYTEKNEDTDTKKLVLVGDIVSTQGTDFYNNGLSGNNAIKAYYLDISEDVQLMGTSKMTWDVLSNNAQLIAKNNMYNRVVSMPNEDVIIKAENYVPHSLRQSLYTYSTDAHMSFSNKTELFNLLNTDDKMRYFIDNNAIINYSVVISRVPTKKSVVDTLVDKVAPYEYTMQAIAEVNTYPYSIATFSELRVPVYFSLDEGSQKCDNYSILLDGVQEDINGLYIANNAITDIGSYEMLLKADKDVAFQYEKKHTVILKNNIDTNENRYKILDGKKMSESIVDYADNVQTKFADYFDTTGVVSTSNFNAKEYFYKGVYRDSIDGEIFDATNSTIKRDITLYVKYELNTEREDAKYLLTDEIARGEVKNNSLKSAVKKTIMTNAIENARTIRNNQMNKTIEEIIDAYNTLKDVIDNTFDEATVLLDANSGDFVNPDSINVIVSSMYSYASLSNVVTKKEGYNFVSWNTKSDGSGENIYPTTRVSATPSEILYAIWQEIVVVNPIPNTKSNHSSSRGGGGGGGGSGSSNQFGSTTTKVGEKVMGQNTQMSIVADFKAIVENSEVFKVAPIYDESKIKYKYDIMPDGGMKLSLLKSDGDNIERLTNNLINVKKTDLNSNTNYKIYSLDENGFAKVGFDLIQNNMYYFDEKSGDNYATLTTGLITTPINMYYYADKGTGKILSGWQNIDGFYYYFNDDAVYQYDDKGNKIGILEAMPLYGSMYFNRSTPDGYMVGVDGKRIIEKPSDTSVQVQENIVADINQEVIKE